MTNLDSFFLYFGVIGTANFGRNLISRNFFFESFKLTLVLATLSAFNFFTKKYLTNLIFFQIFVNKNTIKRNFFRFLVSRAF